MLRWFYVMRTGIRSLLTRRAFDEQLDADIRFHLEEASAEYMRAGLSPDEAQRAALKAFGNPVRVVEDVRETSRWIWWERLVQDCRLACRRLAKQKAFLFTTVPTLALCIGANTAIFSVVNSVILRPLPVPEPERVVTMWNAYPRATGTDAVGGNSPPDYFDRRALTDVFESVAAYDGEVAYNVGGPSEARRIPGVQATPSLFHLLRARAMLGRTFDEGEGQPGHDLVVVLSYGLWQELFAGDPSAVGRDLHLDGRPYTIVGVMPADFASVPVGGQERRLWTALAFTPEQRQRYHFNNRWTILARLQLGVTLAQAQARIDTINQRNMDRMPELKPVLVDAGFHTPVRVLQDELVRDVRGILFLLWGGVTCVLLIGAVNVANLVLVRATARGREIATCVALGASRVRIARQIVTESLLLAVLGGLVGWLIAWAGLGALGALGIDTLPRSAEIWLDRTAMVFTIAVVGIVGAVMALLPAVRILRVSPTDVLREGGRSGTDTRGVRVARQALVATQIAMALVLLAGAGLLLASFRALLAVDPGFEPRGVLTARVDLPESSRYENDAARRSFFVRALAGLRALPGVESAGVANYIPFGGAYSRQPIFPEGYAPRPGESVVSPSQSIVSSGYFDAMAIRIIEGRDFDDRDSTEGRPAIVIDQRLARRFWPDGGAIGRRMWRPPAADAVRDPSRAPHFDIVGIVESVQLRGVSNPADDVGAYYFPFAQRMDDDVAFAIRTSGEPDRLVEPVRRAIGEIDPELPVFDIRSMEERIDRSLSDRRTPMVLTLGFGLLALLLAVIGVYGVVASLVQQRTREIGIRMALGSDGTAILRLVLSEGAVMIGCGLLAGLAGIVAMRRAIESQLHAVSPLEPGVLAIAIVLMIGAAVAACLIPAHRATRLDPVSVLAES